MRIRNERLVDTGNIPCVLCVQSSYFLKYLKPIPFKIRDSLNMEKMRQYHCVQFSAVLT